MGRKKLNIKKNNKPKIVDENKDTVLESLKEELTIPSGYFAVDLPSQGLLGYPKTIHIRHYSLYEMMDLSLIEQIDDTFIAEIEAKTEFLKCLNNMIYEDVDVLEFHERDIVYLLFQLFITSSPDNTTFKNRTYYIKDKLKGSDLSDEKNTGKVDIDVSKMGATILLNPKVSEPIKINDTVTNTEILIRLQRIKDLILAGRKVIEEFKEPISKYEDIKQKTLKREAILNNKNLSDEEKEQAIDKIQIDEKRFEEFYELLKRRKAMLLVYARSQIFLKIGNKELKTFEEKIEAVKLIRPNFWKQMYEKLGQLDTFGINEYYSFHCPVNKKSITRRFVFRVDDFIHSLQETNATGYDFVFDL